MLRLLIVDDDEVDRAAVRRALASSAVHFELVEATSATDGLERASASVFDCILLDYRLPELTGGEVLEKLRAQGCQAPVVILTGHGDEDLAVELMKAGASDYIPKGALNPPRLLQSVRQAVRMHRVESEARGAARRHTVQLQGLAEAAIALNAILSAEAISHHVAERARTLTMAESAVARAIVPRSEASTRCASGDEAEFASVVAALPGPVRSGGPALSQFPALERLVELGFPAPQQSWLAAPLTDRNGARIGILHVCDARAGAFLENDEAILVQLAHMASIAIENAWLYESARAAVKARDDMIEIVSHDLRNPLNTIVIGASMLDSASLPPHASQTVQRMGRAAQRMNGLVNDLLDVARIDAGTLVIEPMPEALAPIVDEAIDQLRPIAAEKNVGLTSAVAPDMQPVVVDRHRLMQVLSNLVGNALKFTAAGGTVRIEAEQAPGAARVHVQDTGVGIASEHTPHLFKRYWQADRASSVGAGLGLFITKGIVEAHGGRITVDSTLGAGTTFSFTLPWAAPDDGSTA
jgi:signal transduction histidine kinase